MHNDVALIFQEIIIDSIAVAFRIADENIAHMILFKERTCILRIFVHPAYIRLALRIVDAVIVEERAGSRYNAAYTICRWQLPVC